MYRTYSTALLHCSFFSDELFYVETIPALDYTIRHKSGDIGEAGKIKYVLSLLVGTDEKNALFQCTVKSGIVHEKSSLELSLFSYPLCIHTFEQSLSVPF